VKTRRFEWTAAAAAIFALICFVWLAAEVSGGRTADFDAAWRDRIHSAATPGLTLLMQAVTLLGSQPALIGSVCVAALIMARSGRRARAILALAALAGCQLLLFVLKHAFQRARPEAFYGDALSTYSFPSGHAFQSLTCYGILAVLATADLAPAPRWASRMAVLIFVITIGLSRVYLGVHHPTDVIAGFLAGMVWLASLAAVYFRVTAVEP
jgi:undecaprenyl-diphosphatase